MFKGIGNLAAIVKQAQQLGGRMQEITEQLKSRRATGAAGGGMVQIEVNGLGEVLRCQIDDSLFAGGDRELIEDLIVAAANQAQAKAKELHAEALKSLSGDMDMPGLNEAMAKLMGGPGE